MSEHTTKRRNPAHPHYWIPEFLLITRKRPRRQIRLMLLATLVGVATGTGAVLFYVATVVAVRLALGGGAGYWPEPHPGGEPHLIWPVLPRHEFIPGPRPPIPACARLRSGLLVGMFAPEAEGHGTDAAIKAYHEKDGLIRPRVPLVKTLASALTIGSGGSGGREGPIAQIGAGIGSTLANLLGLAPRNGASSWPRAWAPAWRRSSGPRWRAPSSPRKSSTGRPSSSPRSSSPPGSPASYPTTPSARCSAGPRCSGRRTSPSTTRSSWDPICCWRSP